MIADRYPTIEESTQQIGIRAGRTQTVRSYLIQIAIQTSLAMLIAGCGTKEVGTITGTIACSNVQLAINAGGCELIEDKLATACPTWLAAPQADSFPWSVKSDYFYVDINGHSLCSIPTTPITTAEPYQVNYSVEYWWTQWEVVDLFSYKEIHHHGVGSAILDITVLPPVSPASADIEVTLLAAPNPAIAGDTLSYRITVTNHGPQAASQIRLTDLLPTKPSAPNEPLTVVGKTAPTGAVCNPVGKTLECWLPRLDTGAQTTMAIEVLPVEPGAVTNKVSVLAAEDGVPASLSDPPANNESTVTTQAIAPPALLARDDVFAVLEDDTLAVAAPGVLQNDIGAAGLTLGSGPMAGASLTLKPDGSFTYTPPNDFYGTDSFTYVAKDSSGNASNEATATITVNPVNDPPTLDPLPPNTLSAPSTGREYTLALSGIGSGAANETQQLAVMAISSDLALIPQPSVDYVSPNGTGTLKFTPARNASGTANITVTVQDDGGSPGVPADDRQFSRSVAVEAVPFDPTTVNLTAIRPNAWENAQGAASPGFFRFERSGTPGSELVVSFTVAGTATNGTDYQSLNPAKVTIPANASSVDLPITPIADGTAEGIETVVLTIAADPSYDVGPQKSAIVAIADAVPVLPARSTVAIPPNPGQVLIVDLNGDAQKDIAVATLGSNPRKLSVAMNQGNGIFTAPAGSIPLLLTGHMATGDFNGDGLEDIVGLTPSAIHVLLSKGDGNFQPEIVSSRPSRSQIFIRTGDVNSDHQLDVLVGDPIQVMLGDGSGNFTAGASVPLTNDGSGFALGDLDNDGNPDLVHEHDAADPVVGGIDMGIDLFRGDGAGNFSAAGRIAAKPHLGYFFAGNPPLIVRDLAQGPAEPPPQAYIAGGDRSNPRIHVLYGNGNFTFDAPKTYPTFGGIPTQLSVGDVDGDLDMDLVTAEPSSKSLSLFINTGARQFNDAQAIDLHGAIAVGDLNGDGKAEIVVASPGAVPATDPGVVTIVSGLP